MKIESKFSKTGEKIFEANTDWLPEGGVEIIDHSVEGNFGSAKIKAFIQHDLILCYTYNRYVTDAEFTISLDPDLIVNTLVLNSEGGVWKLDFEPYLLSPDDAVTSQLFKKSEFPFRTPQNTELFRTFATLDYYLSILKNYGETFKDLISKIENNAVGNIFPEMLCVSPRMKIIVKEIINYNSTNEVICRNFIRNKAMEIIHMQLEQIMAQTEIQNTSKLNIIDKEKIVEAQKILVANFQIPPTIRQLSLMVATNEFKLKWGFNQLYNISMHQYIINLRIEKAIELMYNENISLNQISDMVGYATLSSFIKAFKKVKGISPGVFRTSK